MANNNLNTVRPIDLVGRAQSYLHCASLALAAVPNVKDQLIIIDPLSQMIAHAAELTLKVFIALNKGTYNWTHDLAQHLVDAKVLGFASPKEFDDYIDYTSQYCVDHLFRYRKGETYGFMMPEQALPLVAGQTDAVLGMCLGQIRAAPKSDEDGLLRRQALHRRAPLAPSGTLRQWCLAGRSTPWNTPRTSLAQRVARHRQMAGG